MTCVRQPGGRPMRADPRHVHALRQMRRLGTPQGSDDPKVQALGAPPLGPVSDEAIENAIVEYGDCGCERCEALENDR